MTSRWGGARYLPYAFTEHGIIMLASVLNSPTAVEASVRITDTFVAMRRALASIAPLLSRIEATERRQLKLEDSQVRNEERFKLTGWLIDGPNIPGRPFWVMRHRTPLLT